MAHQEFQALSQKLGAFFFGATKFWCHIGAIFYRPYGKTRQSPPPPKHQKKRAAPKDGPLVPCSPRWLWFGLLIDAMTAFFAGSCPEIAWIQEVKN